MEISGGRRVALVPGVLALLPEYASSADPVPELRAACLAAVGWLGPDPVIVADEQGTRVAQALLGEAVVEEGAQRPSRNHLVVANGSACRTPAAPGAYDERAEPFDDVLATGLLGPDPAALRGIDNGLAAELWAGTAMLPRLADLLTGEETVAVDYDDAPFGVQYWVVRYAG